ncbi:hypothetical protein WOLCODRAFT_164684 [Wolfiporia cocos MD-104 SS10]|uniref:F-box domain-containing protein n=1 Tax=Wolfiporia cocos (strain MD-104) TaxID=742152 RepID=A0A2H3JPD1_WOLCO|nr:hypothetical protein WOLCODRAFT_164684 [Wolfiporia cocos MD-104 SS10]
MLLRFPHVAKLMAEEARSQSYFKTTATGEYVPTGIIPKLPNEIFYEITLFTDYEDLTNLVLANRTFRSASEALIYRCLSLNDKRRKMIKCLQTLAAYPRLALHVRRLCIGKNIEDGHYFRSFFVLFQRALRNLVNLEEFNLYLHGSYAPYLFGAPFCIRKLTTACDWGPDFVRWLEEHPELQTLLFCAPRGRVADLPKGALPNLKRISGPPVIVTSCVPGRPIIEVEVCLMHPSLVHPDMLSRIARLVGFSTGPVRDLTIVAALERLGDADILSSFRVIPEELPKLEVFGIHTMSGKFTQGICAGMGDILAHFHKLERLSFISNKEDAIHDKSKGRELATSWHSRCNTLEIVCMPGQFYIRDRERGWMTLADLEQALIERQVALWNNKDSIALNT